MITDLQTFLWESPEQLGAAMARKVNRQFPEPWHRPDTSADAFDQAMEPVDYAVVLGFQSALIGASIPTAQVARAVARRPDRLLGFAGIDPCAPGMVGAVNDAVHQGLVGVVISPAAQGFHPGHSMAMRLYEICEDRGLPILILPGTDLSPQSRLEFAQPFLLDEIARTFEKLRIVVADVGAPWVDQMLALVQKHPSVYASVAGLVRRPWALFTTLLAAYELGVMEKLLFGSDFPLLTPQESITRIYTINTLPQGTGLPTLPREQLRQIVERDTLGCLGLARPPGAVEPEGSEMESTVGAQASIGESIG